MTKDTPHHHGNLRAALIACGLEILATEGIDGLTLRKVAARAGVSHAAPAHHFAGKAGLLAAISAHGYDVFTQSMLAERYANGRSPQDQLAGIARGYLKFAEIHPALFALIFATDLTPESVPELLSASARAYEVLEEVCSLFKPSPLGPGVNETTVWSVVHGYAELRRLRRYFVSGAAPIIPIEAVLPKLEPRNT